jgi:hypothetical protein
MLVLRGNGPAVLSPLLFFCATVLYAMHKQYAVYTDSESIPLAVEKYLSRARVEEIRNLQRERLTALAGKMLDKANLQNEMGIIYLTPARE